jgi:hypothetical protein
VQRWPSMSMAVEMIGRLSAAALLAKIGRDRR